MATASPFQGSRMSPQPTAETAPSSQPPGQPERLTYMQRLIQLQRALQRKLRRRPTDFEKATLDKAALLMLRAEAAARDPSCDANTIVRLHNASRRALSDFERVCRPPRADDQTPTLAQVLRG